MSLNRFWGSDINSWRGLKPDKLDTPLQLSLELQFKMEFLTTRGVPYGVTN